jgi:hypothetical protein
VAATGRRFPAGADPQEGERVWIPPPSGRPTNFRGEVVDSEAEVGGGIGGAAEIIGGVEGVGSFCATGFTIGDVGPEAVVA